MEKRRLNSERFYYRHLIAKNEAREGFRIGSHHFRVLAFSDDKTTLKRLKS